MPELPLAAAGASSDIGEATVRTLSMVGRPSRVAGRRRAPHLRVDRFHRAAAARAFEAGHADDGHVGNSAPIGRGLFFARPGRAPAMPTRRER